MNYHMLFLHSAGGSETGSIPALLGFCFILAAFLCLSRFRSGTGVRRTAAVLCVISVLFLSAGFLPAAQAQDSCTAWEEVGTWAALGNKLGTGGCIRLSGDITRGETDQNLTLNNGAVVTLDLNGHMINGDNKSFVIWVGSGCTLNLYDNEGGGTITGGSSDPTTSPNGGGVYVDGTFNMYSGTISGNTSKYGGGVYVNENRTFNMYGGTISGNSAAQTTEGGDGGGVYVKIRGTFTMSGGTITNNTSDGYGGGVYVSNGSTFNLSGNPVISGNKNSGWQSNAYLPQSQTITISDTLAQTALIGVTTGVEPSDGNPVVITSGLSGRGGNLNFFNDEREGYNVNLNDAGEAILIVEYERTLIYDSNGASGQRQYIDGAYSVPHEITLSYPGGTYYNIGTQGSEDPITIEWTGNGTFLGWNTKPDGTGITYREGTTILLTGDLTLYAQWGYVAEVEYSGGTTEEFGTLQDALDAVNHDAVEIYLLTDIDTPEKAGEWPLVTGTGDVTLHLNDRNGTPYSIDRKQTSPAGNGHVITVSNTAPLTIDGGGEIRGGNSNGAGTGGCVVVNGYFTMKGGTITGCTGYLGGGVYVWKDATFDMDGGTISGNTSNQDGGGVYVDYPNGQFNMSGGTISYNGADSHGGGVYVAHSYTDLHEEGKFAMSGEGTISHNEASNGGGVYNYGDFTMTGGMISNNKAHSEDAFTGEGGGVHNGGTFSMEGGKITENTAENSGGGVYRAPVSNSSLIITGGEITGNTASANGGGINLYGNGNEFRGNPKITGNTVNGAANNVYLYNPNFDVILKVTGPLSNIDPIGITMQTPGVFTGSTPTDYNNAAKFTSDNSSYYVAQYIQGEPDAGQNVGQLYLNNAIPISSVAVTDIEVPAAGTALDTDAAATSPETGNVSLGEVTWKAGDVTVSGNAGYGTAYTAVVTATAPNAYCFNSQATATVNGNDATSVSVNSDGTLITITYTFPKTKKQLTITTQTGTKTYAPDGISDPFSGMFTFPQDYTGTAGYALASESSDTGVGTYDSTNNKLNVTKAGTFTVKASAPADSTYISAEATAMLTVNKAANNVTAPTITGLTYGGTPNPSGSTADSGSTDITYEYSKEENGTYQTAPSFSAGTWYVRARAAATDNYNEGVSEPTSFEIAAASMTVIAAGYTGTYDGGPHSISVTVEPSDAGIAYRESADGEYTLTDNPQYTNAGTYTVYYQVTKQNYTPVTGSQTVSIGKKSLSVTAKPKTITYGDEAANDGVSYDGFVAGQTETVLGGTLSYNYSYAQYGNVGNTYTITPSGLTADNYDITFTPGTLTVVPKEVAVSWGSTDLTFSGEEQAPEASVADGYLVNGDSCTVTVSGQQTDAGVSYTAAAEALSNSNYTLPDVKPTTEFTIAKAAGPVLDDITVSDIYTITSKTVDVSANIPNMPANAGDLSYAVKQVSPEGAVNASADIDAGGKLTFSLQDGADGDRITAVVTVSSKNYENSDVNVVLELGPKEDAEVSFGEENPLKVTWGDSLTLYPSAANEGTNGGWTLSSSEESVAVVTDDGKVTILKTGETTITAEYDSDTSTGSAKLLLTVEPKSIAGAAVTLSGKEFDYDETEKSVTVESVVLDGKTLAEGVDYAVSGNTGTDAGTHTVTVTGKGNYTDSVSADWSIVKPEFTVTWLMDDGSEIDTTKVIYGETPAHADPEKKGDDQYTWIFSSWDPEPAAVKADTSYKAVFNSMVNQYEVTFVDEDGKTVLKEAVKYDYGTKADEIAKPDPVKSATEQYTYTFAGWDPAVTDVTENVTYKATYTTAARQYEVSFVDEDGKTVLKEAVKYDYGTKSDEIAKPADPVKPATAEFSYTFAGWDPALADVTDNVTYKASYKAAAKQYEVSFVDEDGKTVLKEAVKYDYGTKAAEIAAPADPVKPATAQYTYTFSGWDPALKDVTRDAVYTAVYTASLNRYAVIWMNYDGAILKEEEYDYGAKPVYAGSTPVKEEDAVNTYLFNGWTPEISTVTGNTGYTAVFIVQPKIFSVVVSTDGNGTASADTLSGPAGTVIKLSAQPMDGYHFLEWELVSGNAEISGDSLTIVSSDVEVKAVFEKDEGLYYTDAGEGQSYELGSWKTLKFTVKRSTQDELTYSLFRGLQGDGQELNPAFYEIGSGSVIIRVSPFYLESLAAGEHTLTVLFADGELEIPYMVSEPEVTETMELNAEVSFVNNDGSRGIPLSVGEMTLKPVILIMSDDKTIRSMDAELTISGGMDRAPMTVTFNGVIDHDLSGCVVEITGLPKTVVAAENYGSFGMLTTVYTLRMTGWINNSGGITLILFWDDGSGDPQDEPPAVYPLPEDEIGAYTITREGMKEYLIYQTYDICMAYLGSDDLCRGSERCYHK